MKRKTALSISVGCFAMGAALAFYDAFIAPFLGGTAGFGLGLPLVAVAVGGILLAQVLQGNVRE